MSLFAVTVDCPEPLRLARFYQEITGGELFASNDDFVVLASESSVRLDFQRVDGSRPRGWPDTPAGVHLDFAVEDLDQAEARLRRLGAVRPEFQPGGQRFRVLLDPAGHAFCLATREAAVTPRTTVSGSC